MVKGNLLVGQSGGPTAVINASLYGVVSRAMNIGSFGRVLGMRYGIAGFMNDEILDFSRCSARTLDLLQYTPGSALGSSRYKLKDEDLPVLLRLLEQHEIRALLMIGGNDTMDTVNRIERYCRESGYDLRGIGIPKTVDNDLFGTDHTPGYPSAARYNIISVRQGGRLASSMQRVDRFTIMQTVGRDAGWLAASTALAKKVKGDAPHFIYIPERPLSREQVLGDVESAISDYGWCHIVAGEGVRWCDGTPVSAGSGRDDFSNIEFGAAGGASAALNLHSLISRETGYRGEFQIPESLAMCAADRASPVDRAEALACGVSGVDLLLGDNSGLMVAIRRLSSDPYEVEYTTVALHEVAVRARPMPDEFISSTGSYVSEEFIKYLAPLTGSFDEMGVL
ncbi:MAG TPA: diphosphate--fructose-6-phosphate 1-phosphotransferase [Spirochaetota bacterium]|nr:diphosphate--fructose-6-phosphate 1-phosphotransferase [Spirochaetota bacterium]